jgi:hypothetical protein
MNKSLFTTWPHVLCAWCDEPITSLDHMCDGEEREIMSQKGPPGLLEVGVNIDNQVAVKLPNGRTKILLFTPEQARHLAQLLYKHADSIDQLKKKVVRT